MFSGHYTLKRPGRVGNCKEAIHFFASHASFLKRQGTSFHTSVKLLHASQNEHFFKRTEVNFKQSESTLHTNRLSPPVQEHSSGPHPPSNTAKAARHKRSNSLPARRPEELEPPPGPPAPQPTYPPISNGLKTTRTHIPSNKMKSISNEVK